MKHPLAGVALVLLFLAGAAAPASFAQAGQGGSQPIVNSWALMPTGADPSQPSSRVSLSYDLAAGATLRDSVTLWNYSNVQLTFQTYATDAFNNAQGAFEALTGGKPPADAGSWVTLAWNQLTVRAHGKVDIPMTLVVPGGARPGDHAGAILAANQVQGTSANGKTVNLDRRTGTRLYIRVAGPVRPALVVENVHTVFHPKLNPLGGSMDVAYVVRNAGNVRLAAHQHVAAKGPFGLATRSHKLADVPELLPGNAISLNAHFASVPALVRATGEINLQPFSPDADVTAVPPVRRAGHTWSVPWSVLALILAVWLARRTYLPIRRRRRELKMGSSPPQATLTPVP